MKRLVLLGAGHAHLYILKQWALSPVADTEVVLVSPYPQAVYSGMVPGYVAGHFSLDQCQIPIEPLAQRAQIVFIPTAASESKLQEQQVVLANGQCLEYDYLSLDMGSTIDRQAIPGAHELALFVRPMEIFVDLWQRMVEVAQEKPMRVSVIGAGAAGVELALAMKWRLKNNAVVSLITGGAPPCSTYASQVQQRVMTALRRSNIALLQITNLTCLALFSGGSKTYIYKSRYKGIPHPSFPI